MIFFKKLKKRRIEKQVQSEMQVRSFFQYILDKLEPLEQWRDPNYRVPEEELQPQTAAAPKYSTRKYKKPLWASLGACAAAAVICLSIFLPIKLSYGSNNPGTGGDLVYEVTDPTRYAALAEFYDDIDAKNLFWFCTPVLIDDSMTNAFKVTDKKDTNEILCYYINGLGIALNQSFDTVFSPVEIRIRTWSGYTFTNSEKYQELPTSFVVNAAVTARYCIDLGNFAFIYFEQQIGGKTFEYFIYIEGRDDNTTVSDSNVKALIQNLILVC